MHNTQEANAKMPTLDVYILYQDLALALNTLSKVKMIGLAILLLEHKSSPANQRDHFEDSPSCTRAATRTTDLCDACRRRKSKCVIHEGQRACVLCQFHSQVCSLEYGSQHRLESLTSKGREDLSISNSNGNEKFMRAVLNDLSVLREDFLGRGFSEKCRRRKCLTPEEWLLTFADLCWCAILKSLLIDAQVGMDVSDNGAQAGIAARIDCAYKVLISIFAWATKADLLVEWYHHAEMGDPLSGVAEWEKERFKTLCRLVQRDEWENRGVKSSKDFLMGLGSGFYNDGTYNGFYVQQYGLKEPRRSKNKSSSQNNEVIPQSPENSLQVSAPRLPRLREMHHLGERAGAAPLQSDGNIDQDGSGTYQQHVAEGSSLPTCAPLVRQSQSLDLQPQDVIAFPSLPRHATPYVCTHPLCKELRFFSIEGVRKHESSVHARKPSLAVQRCVCHIMTCERSVVSRAFYTRQDLLNHMRHIHNMQFS